MSASWRDRHFEPPEAPWQRRIRRSTTLICGIVGYYMVFVAQYGAATEADDVFSTLRRHHDRLIGSLLGRNPAASAAADPAHADPFSSPFATAPPSADSVAPLRPLSPFHRMDIVVRAPASSAPTHDHAPE